jgi:predicted transcriptional regulator
MHRSFPTASVEEPLELALARLQTASVSFLPVLNQGQVVGMLTPQSVRELLQTQAAWRSWRGQSSPVLARSPSTAPLGPFVS